MATIQFRRGTAAQWTATNPILANAELGYETDTGKYKIGNGSTNWVSLPYANTSGGSVTSVNGQTGDVTIAPTGVLTWNGQSGHVIYTPPTGSVGSGGTTYYNTTYIDQSAGTSDTYGTLLGTINGINTLFTVSQSRYASGSLKVYLNGQLQTQGTTEDWVETDPSLGTFSFITPPVTGDYLTAEYQLTSSSSGGTIVGSSLLTLTGAVTGSGIGTVVTTLAPNIVGIHNLSASGTPSASKYLRGDNTWATIVAGGSGSTNDIELTLQMITLISYVEYTYDLSGNLTNKDIWEDNTKTNKYYSILYNYTGDDLTSLDVTRETDSFSYTKTFTYLDGNLVSSTIN